MSNIRSISDMRSCSDILHNVNIHPSAFLTEPDSHESIVTEKSNMKKTDAALKLMAELAKGKKSGEEKGWLSSSDVKAHFRTKANET
ncbi:MAG: prevent-host-death protein [Lachnospiraceae bacterium]|jgi:hypothetical protein|nr:prevent-host-death protein [Lachnospiraceae bacterium]MCI9060020.1 prevent-host-death protein [Lachnospiraceae bacterium]GFI30436.1 hypothetical protein IMSAGC013_01826 [Lachnospiraceae bacterium]